jgi:hypothetical protein
MVAPDKVLHCFRFRAVGQRACGGRAGIVRLTRINAPPWTAVHSCCGVRIMRIAASHEPEHRAVFSLTLALAITVVLVISIASLRTRSVETTGIAARSEQPAAPLSSAQHDDAIYAGALERAYATLCARQPPEAARRAIAFALQRAGLAGDARIDAKADEIVARERGNAGPFCTAAEWVFLSLDRRRLTGE